MNITIAARHFNEDNSFGRRRRRPGDRIDRRSNRMNESVISENSLVFDLKPVRQMIIAAITRAEILAALTLHEIMRRTVCARNASQAF
jgi:hypothetical protein